MAAREMPTSPISRLSLENVRKSSEIAATDSKPEMTLGSYAEDGGIEPTTNGDAVDGNTATANNDSIEDQAPQLLQNEHRSSLEGSNGISEKANRDREVSTESTFSNFSNGSTHLADDSNVTGSTPTRSTSATFPGSPTQSGSTLDNGGRHQAVLSNGFSSNSITSISQVERSNGGEYDRITMLEDELNRTKSDKEAFEAQYRSLLGKLTTMRNTLGDKLRQDADELDRREAEINDLRAANEDLGQTIETLKSELISSNAESEHVHSELEQLRLRAFDSQAKTSEEASEREMALREAQEDLERVRMEREDWEGEAMRERVAREALTVRLEKVEMELAHTKGERENLRDERDREAESASNLHAVLEEFQAAKEKELESTLGNLQAQLRHSEESLANYKQYAARAEASLSAAQNDSEKVLALTKEVKDKTLLIGKLRHEAVILNEHLTEALRRLKRDSSENSVDRRLVSNVFITFLNTPRADTKRFEMLQLLSSILSWSDDQREQVGLQRSSGLSAPGIIASGKKGAGKGHSRSGKGKAVDDGLGENETFSNLWIEFLLKEASQGSSNTTSPTTQPTSPKGSPNTSSGNKRYNLPELGSPPASFTGSRRPSFNLTNPSQPPPSSSGSASILEQR